MRSLKTVTALTLTLLSFFSYAQEVPILNYSTNDLDQVQLEVASSEDNYYILNIRHEPTGDFELSTSMTLGQQGTTWITEPLQAYPVEHYQVLEYPIAAPADTDGDGVDDITEFSDASFQSPINYAEPVPFVNGSVMVHNMTTFHALATDNETVPWAPFLDGQEFFKFVIIDYDTDEPQLYFVNSETHFTHQEFGSTIGVNVWANNVVKGEIIYYPAIVANNGELGLFAWNFTYAEVLEFETTQKAHELIAANMPFLQNNLSFFVIEENQEDYEQDQALYEDSRIPILFEADIYEDIDYLPLNITEGYGYFRLMELSETPGSKDVVLYETLPNSLPRVGGIMTSFIQTPLSHVNLRAIQDNVPNAFIRDPLLVDSIVDLLDNYVYYRVEQDEYYIREATVDEVNEWFEDLRPDNEQIPALNLSYTDILPLDSISFDKSDGFGAKCANVATMRTFGFPDGTIPDGFGVPFYFYQEFMEYNGFFDVVETMIADPDFQTDLDYRIQTLKDFRDEIKAADMPQWMLDELQVMHESFPDSTSVRCRSSTNNEDLPGFSGAGLYTSKTQHPSEGHISKSIKQVYASMWNFRAYDERDFYRIDQYVASMGVLCHPNYTDEKANGVGVSTDPIYETNNTYYLNTQIGEDLITNPDVFSIPEEILLDKFQGGDDYVVVRRSNLVPNNVIIMEEVYLDEIRAYLTTIHDEFAILYDAVGVDEFAMDIEYKITSDDQLIIKQARPWASYWSELEPPVVSTDELQEVDMSYFPNPVDDYLNIQCACDATQIRITNSVGQLMLEQTVDFATATTQISTKNWPAGMYLIDGLGENGEFFFAKKFIKR